MVGQASRARPSTTWPPWRGCRSPPRPRRSTAGSTCAAETRQRVLAAAEELAFQPNALARGLLSGQTRTVGLLTSDSVGPVRHPGAAGRGGRVRRGRDGGVALRRPRRRHPRAALRARAAVAAGRRPDRGRREHRPAPVDQPDLPVPVVYAYGASDDPDDVSFVPDDVGGAALAVQHLLAMGRRRIAHITGPDRLQGRAGPGRGRCGARWPRRVSPRPARRCPARGRSGGGGTRRRCC